MRFDLAAMAKRARKTRRASITLRPISPPATFALDLYREGYLPIIAVWEAALPDILATYARTLAATQTDSPADVRVELTAAESGIVGVIVQARLRLERWAARFASWHTARWRANVLAATGVDLAMMLGPVDMAEPLALVIERNVSLISSVSNQARDRIAEAVFRGLRDRRPADEVAREVREATGMARARAKRIAGDQLVKTSSALNEERRRQAGIDTFEWISSGKLHFRPEHLARNGKLYSENAERQGHEYQGKTINKPPPSDDLPGIPINCGCTSRAVLVLD